MRRSWCRFLLLLLLLLLDSAAAQQESGFYSQQDVLLSLYNATSGNRWKVRANWPQDSSSTSSGDNSTLRLLTGCDYWGVTCFSDTSDTLRYGHVQAIDLTDNALVGIVPEDILDALPYLETLVLRSNRDLVVRLGTEATREEPLLANNNNNIQNASLVHLDVSECTLEEPTTLAHLVTRAPALQVLRFSNCHWTGTFPTELLHLTDLRELYADGNAVTGPLPDGLGQQMINLQELVLQDNQMTGPLPTSLGLLRNLQTLNLAGNAWTGVIPTQLEQLTALQNVALDATARSSKALTGPLPPFANAPNLIQLNLQQLNLTGTIPPTLLQASLPDSKLVVNITGNQLTGDLPQQLLLKSRLNLYAADNRLILSNATCAALPGGWMDGQVALLQATGGSSSGCRAVLCPPGTFAPGKGRASTGISCLPCTSGATYWGSTTCASAEAVLPTDPTLVLQEIYKALEGRYWKRADQWLSSPVVCDYYGVDCNDAGVVSGLKLRQNGLTGTLPNHLLAQLPGLQDLDVSGNALTVQFKGMGALTSLQTLNLAQTGLDSADSINELASLSKLLVLDISSNGLKGSLATEIFQISSLEELDLSHNQFSGTIPTLVGMMVNLQLFKCFGNLLSGSLPSELGDLLQLQKLLAAENRFSGPLPSALNNLSKLDTLSFHQAASSSNLSGPLPSFRNMEQLVSLQLDGNALSGSLPDDFLLNTRRGDGRIELFLSDNKFSGAVPAGWASRFSQLLVDVTGNEIDSLGSGLCDQGNWMDGTVATFGCDAIVCPKGTYNEFGRRTNSVLSCETCAAAVYLGSKECGAATQATTTHDILQSFFSSTDGTNWVNKDGWEASSDYCTYYGVACNAARDVVKITLGNNGLTGSPAKNLFQLSSLQELNLPLLFCRRPDWPR
jgi:Leucine-rich repeat (LRR) protein